MSKKKQPEINVVFCTASVGSGHIRAAEAVAEYFKSSQILDILNFTPKWFNKIYHDGYFFAIKHFPKFVGWCYNASDIPENDRGLINDFVCWVEDRICRKFIKNAELQKADIIVSTHFLTSGILARMKNRGEIKVPIVTIVTDNYPHCIWLSYDIDLLCVANKRSSQIAISHGVNPAIVRPTGIPIDSKFMNKSLKISFDQTILVTGGGDGVGKIESTVKNLLEIKNIKVVVVCGNNIKLHDSLSKIKSPQLEVIGFTKRMHELMKQADILVCKPGGLTTTEALVVGLPMILMNPIPGQEERNAQVLVDAGAAVLASSPEDAANTAQMFLLSNKRLGRMKSAAFQISTPNSAKIIAQLISDLRKS
jgi:processive 1,2-diacylglycerol beta-glucosyltransferase